MTALDLDLVTELDRAIDAGEFVLHYQPEVDLADGGVVGMEALLRWQHRRRGLLWPKEFLPVAEASGLILRLGDWVLEQCIRELAHWRSIARQPETGPWQLWMNVSGLQLADPGFVDRVGTLVSGAGLPSGALGLEVTEEALGQDGTPGVLESLRDAGVALAVDDFGTWYSSLATIGEVPVDAIKLDQTFVRGVGSDLDEDTIVAAIIRLAHARHLYVVAEGVESWSEGARLCELGCDRASGFLFNGPEPATRARLLLARGTGWRAPTQQSGAPTPSVS
jgi:EAL domain-containing protein (putative c-di-GMP-specific phosphodiesterase class I)